MVHFQAPGHAVMTQEVFHLQQCSLQFSDMQAGAERGGMHIPGCQTHVSKGHYDGDIGQAEDFPTASCQSLHPQRSVMSSWGIPLYGGQAGFGRRG